MVTPDHFCPWGIKAYDLLKRNGYDIQDKHIESDEANKAYKEKSGVDETPQIFIYPYIEAVGGVLMVASLLTGFIAPLVLIGTAALLGMARRTEVSGPEISASRLPRSSGFRWPRGRG